MELMNTEPDYSVIIPAYNEEQELPETLAAVSCACRACRSRAGEVVVVDNASTDNTVAVARKHGARVVEEPTHRISKVRNTGARAAAGRCLIFIDADTVIEPGMIGRVLETLDGGRVCGGGATVKYKGHPGLVAVTQRKVLSFLSLHGCWAAGAFIFCLRSAFEQIGGFDERLWASEDVDLSRRLIRWGREHRMEFRVLDTPVLTSPRKFEWFSGREILMSQLLSQWKKHSRQRCRIWYERPGSGKSFSN
jgi:glycosyltransferase involved in cell wall biosynthesis